MAIVAAQEVCLSGLHCGGRGNKQSLIHVCDRRYVSLTRGTHIGCARKDLQQPFADYGRCSCVVNDVFQGF